MAYHDFKDNPITLRAHYDAGGDHFVVNGAKRNQNRYQAAASLGVTPKENMHLTFSYSLDWANDFKVKAGLARLQCAF